MLVDDGKILQIFKMLRCEICSINPQTDMLTRCCKLFICSDCRQKYDKTGTCMCGKAITKKLCTANPQLFEIIKNYYAEKEDECDRCDEIAEIECKNCCMLFCARCNAEVHNGKGFAKHKREPYIQGLNPNHAADRARKRQDWCKEHRQPNEAICECGAQLCGICLKNHKESCGKSGKTRSLKQYKEQYFSQILFKIKQITEYKEKLLQQKKNYSDHYKKQKEMFQNYRRLMEEQLEGLKKILEVKTQEIKNRLEDYWRQCQNINNKNSYVIEYYLKKFDDYGRLSQKFIQKTVGLDYLQKRVKRVYINHDFFNFKVLGVEEIQNSIVGMTSNSRQWEAKQDHILINYEAPEEKSASVPKQKKVDLLGNIASNSELLLEISQNPLNHRPLTLIASHNQIQFQFLHLPYQDDFYEIQFGVGLKMKGQEVFKKLKNKLGVGVIDNLNPATKYRVRMRVQGGEPGPVTQIKTQQSPKFPIESGGGLIKNYTDPSTQLLKPGTIYGSNEIFFGIHEWELKIFPGKHSDEETACISIGISNKEQKKPIFVGTTLNYGYHKAVINVRVSLNCEENRLIIISSTGKQEQVFQNLPNYPIYPTLQNKGSNPVQIQSVFL